MSPRVLDDEILSGIHNMLAEGMSQRRLSLLRHRFRQSALRLEKLPVLVDQRDQSHRDLQDTCGQLDQVFEDRLRR